jgi:hypothetical protein
MADLYSSNTVVLMYWSYPCSAVVVRCLYVINTTVICQPHTHTLCIVKIRAATAFSQRLILND